MTSTKKQANTRAALPTWIGAGVGFIAFVLVGAIPGLLYGGYMGLIMAGAASIGLFGYGLGFPIVAVIGLIVLVATLVLSFFVPKLREALPPRA